MDNTNCTTSKTDSLPDIFNINLYEHPGSTNSPPMVTSDSEINFNLESSLISPTSSSSSITNIPLEVIPLTNSNSKCGYTGIASSIINDNGTINLSSYVLDNAEISLLSKGLSFCPTPGPLDMAVAMDDVDKFHRSLRLSSRFGETETLGTSWGPEEGQPFSHRKFRPPSSWQPRGPPFLESFIISNLTAANKLPATLHKHKSNLSQAEKEALSKLASNRNIIIKPADKGSGTVILNKNDYIFEANRQLSDCNFYQR